MNNFTFPSIIEYLPHAQKLCTKADEFQTWAHNSMARTEEKRWRKYTHEPYSVHPRAVANMALNFGVSPAAVAAAFLHDVLEDTLISYEELVTEFGRPIADMVREVTDVSQLEHGNREYRKALDRAHLTMASADMQTVKICDMLHNAFTICRYDEKFRPTFLQEKEKLMRVLINANRAAREVAFNFIEAWK